jgi:hypothetical protein
MILLLVIVLVLLIAGGGWGWQSGYVSHNNPLGIVLLVLIVLLVVGLIPYWHGVF